MTHLVNDTFENELELVATLRDEANKASFDAQELYVQLTTHVSKLRELGVSVDELSAATGLSPDAIRLL